MSRVGAFNLVGPGRAGVSLAQALIDLGWEHASTFGRSDSLSTAAAGVDLCIIATPDSAISDAAAEIDLGDAVVMHLSGAAPLDVLGSHRAAALHPLVSLADPERGARQLRSAWFAVAGDPIAGELAEALSGMWFVIEDTDRALYHATAVVASNHVTALLGQVQRLAAEVGVPFEAFLPLVQVSLDNVALHGPAVALTGPAARGDEQTIAAHLEALERRMPAEVATYRALVEEARRLASQKPRAN